MTGTRQLLCRCHTSRTGADHGHLLAGLDGCRLWHHPTVFPTLVDNEMLNRLDAHGVAVDSQGAGRLARRRANTAGELWEVIGRVQSLKGFLIVAAIHQVIPIGNDVIDRTTVVTKRDAAIHATCTLHLGGCIIEMQYKFLVMLHACLRRFARFFQTLIFHKAGYFTHFPLTFFAKDRRLTILRSGFRNRQPCVLLSIARLAVLLSLCQIRPQRRPWPSLWLH